MFHLTNEVGSAHFLTESAQRREELLRLGFTEVTTAEAAPTGKTTGGKSSKKPTGKATGGKDGESA